MKAMYPDREEVNRVKNEFPRGARVEMVSMGEDPHPIPAGTKGTVDWVDDIATVHVSWDNGRMLGAAWRVDKIRRIDG